MRMKFEVHIFNHVGPLLEQLAFNAQKFRGSRDLGHSGFRFVSYGQMANLCTIGWARNACRNAVPVLFYDLEVRTLLFDTF